MTVYAITYRYTEDAAGRNTHRASHKEFLAALGEKGILRVSGPFGADETPGALLLVSAESKDAALVATKEDPFQRNGLVAEVTVQEWIPMTGPLAGDF